MPLPFAHEPASQRAFCVNFRFTVRPEHRAKTLALLRVDQEGAWAEKGNLQFVVGEDLKSPNSFYIHEEYIGEESFKAHLAAPYCQAFFAFAETGPFVQGKEPVVEAYLGEHAAKKREWIPALCVNATVVVKKEAREDFIKGFTEAAIGASTKEPLCKQYVWGESKDQPSTFHVHEEYIGKNGGMEGVDAHMKTPHLQHWQKISQGFPEGKPKLSVYHTLDLKAQAKL